MKTRENDAAVVAAIGALLGQMSAGPVRDRLESAMRGETAKQPDALRQETLSGEEVARVLNCTRRTVVSLAREGVLARVKFPGRQRGAGYSRASVEKLLEAKGGAA